MGQDERRAGAELDGEVPIAHGIERVLGDGLEAELAGREGTVDGEARPGQRRGPERHDVHPAAAVGKSPPIAEKHLEPGQEVVAQGYRLGGLEVRIARHDGVRLALR